MSDILELKKYSYRLYINLIKVHIKPASLLPSEQEQDSVKAFCVLTHAALEEYFETLTQKVLREAYKKFKSGNFITNQINTQDDIDKANKAIMQIIKTLVLASCYSIYSTNHSDSFNAHSSKLEEASRIFATGDDLTPNDLSNIAKKTDSYVKEILKESIKFFDKQVNNNHGASLKYVLKLLVPVGIDIPQDTTLNSLQKISKYRGEYAHTRGNVTNMISPSDIARYLIDVIRICQKIENSIITL